MRKILFVVVLALAACAPKQVPALEIVVLPSSTEASEVMNVVVSTVTPTYTLIPSESIRGIKYVGYWLKVVKNMNMYESWTMSLYYQEEDNITFVTDFCVRGSDTNTENGFYFLAEDRATKFVVDGEYISSDHNYVIVFAKESWYVHPAPGNNSGIDGCPTRNSAGCINMRPTDLDLLFFGGKYTNPFRGDLVDIPTIGVGTPLVIVDNNIACLWLGQCMQEAACKSGYECFKKFTCRYCTTAEAQERWAKVLRTNPNLEVLDLQK